MDQILIGKGERPVHLLAKYGNRMASWPERPDRQDDFSYGAGRGVLTFGRSGIMADVKGDVAGLALAGTPGEKIQQRVAQIGMEGYATRQAPCYSGTCTARAGIRYGPRSAKSARACWAGFSKLNDTRLGVLEIAFKLADDRGLLLLDLDDLRALLGFVADNRNEISTQYGLVSTQSVAAIQRALLSLEREGGEALFGEPALELNDLLRTDLSGRGIVNILVADQLILKPRLYSSFLLWLLSELFENLPEVGDLDKPKLVFFFDEAHLLFDDAPSMLRQRVEQAVRIIRSKGVGVYFCSQFPDDVPNEILGQLGNRIQHALRAYTPRDQKAVKTAAETFVANPKLDVAEVISQLGVGEALVSTLQGKGVPMPVERTLICPPRCRMGAVTPEERAAVRARSPISGKYDSRVNRESAYEILSRRTLEKEPAESKSNRTEGEKSSERGERWGFTVGHQAPAGHGGNAGQTDGPYRWKRDRQADLPGRAGSILGRLAPPLGQPSKANLRRRESVHERIGTP